MLPSILVQLNGNVLLDFCLSSPYLFNFSCIVARRPKFPQPNTVLASSDEKYQSSSIEADLKTIRISASS